MEELWQLYDEQGRPISSRGAAKKDIRTGLLHGAAHVWIWRIKDGKTELLLQKRAITKNTWPDLWDISAAGHIDLGETPLEAAVRETKEELGLDIKENDLRFVAVTHANITAPSGIIENEMKWIYIIRREEETSFNLQKSEVEALEWKDLDEFKAEIFDAKKQEKYTPQGEGYFEALFQAITAELS